MVDRNAACSGIDALRVVDASIMPSSPPATSTRPAIMIAEKASDMIRAAAAAALDVPVCEAPDWATAQR